MDEEACFQVVLGGGKARGMAYFIACFYFYGVVSRFLEGSRKGVGVCLGYLGMGNNKVDYFYVVIRALYLNGKGGVFEKWVRIAIVDDK